MTEFDETIDPAEDAHAVPAEEAGDLTAEAAAPPRKRSLLKRVGLTLLVIVGMLVVAGFMLYNYGSMERPSPEMRAQYEALAAAGQAPRLPKAGFHLPIPGCKCHSSDPVQTIAHEGYRIRDCGNCHGAGAVQAQATAPAY